MSTQYTLSVKNNSSLTGSVCVYQRDPEQDIHQNLYSLAWFSKSCHPGTTLKFRWTIDYSFVWCETGVLQPGVFFDASEVKSADPSNISMNATGFALKEGAYKFTPPPRSAALGSLDIITDGSIPVNRASIGIGMSGQSAFACPATPNFNFSFMPHPQYWVAFGNYQEGEVIDLNRVSQTIQVNYPVNTYSQTLSFNEDNTWSIITLQKCNANILQAKLNATV